MRANGTGLVQREFDMTRNFAIHRGSAGNMMGSWNAADGKFGFTESCGTWGGRIPALRLNCGLSESDATTNRVPTAFGYVCQKFRLADGLSGFLWEQMGFNCRVCHWSGLVWRMWPVSLPASFPSIPWTKNKSRGVHNPAIYSTYLNARVVEGVEGASAPYCQPQTHNLALKRQNWRIVEQYSVDA
jgi:hypothetical protein